MIARRVVALTTTTALRGSAVGLLAAALVVVLGATRCERVHAQSESETQQARAAFEEAVRLMQEQRFSDAIPLLERSRAIRETPPVVFNLGLAYRGTGDYTRAMEALRRVVAITEGVGRHQELRARALQIVGELASSRGRLILVIRGGATAVTLDGQTLAGADGRFEREVDPGRHTLEVSRPGHDTVTRVIEVGAGETTTVEVDASERPHGATLRVATDPPEADIRIDGVLVGAGNVERQLGPGRHTVEVRARGYRTARIQVSLEPGSMMVREIVLASARRGQTERDPSSSGSVLSQWWFWTIVGAVVAGGTVAVVVAAQPGTAPYEGGSLGMTVVALER